MRKSLYIAAILTSAAPNVAQAQDDWTGPYVGGHIEAASLQTDFEDLGCWTACTEPSLREISPLVGATIGYDVQTKGNLVLGVAAEIGSGTTMTADSSASGLNPTGETIWKTKVGVQYAARARVGGTFGNSLVFVYAGAAFAKADISVAARNFPVYGRWPAHGSNYNATWSGTLSGITYGVGVEHKIGDFSVKAELGLTRYSPVQTCFANTDGLNQGVCWADPEPIPAQMQNLHSASAARIGINYRF